MYKLIFILFIILIITFTIKQKFKEGLVSSLQTTQCASYDGKSRFEPSDITFYFTNNNINYNFIDDSILSLQRQYDYYKDYVDNFTIKLGKIEYNENSNDKPSISIGGSVHENITLDFTFSPSPQGPQGPQGLKGAQGPDGFDGDRGATGGRGYYGLCGSTVC